MKHVSILCALAILSTSALAAGLVAREDVILCKYLVDLEAVELLSGEQHKATISLYLDGANPPCMILVKGEFVELLDRAGKNIQVVTRHGTPRFIGWGKQSLFD